MHPPLPLDEVARLATLVGCGLLDTEADPRLDELVRFCAAAFSVPVALISLVDRERQWFKSRVGLSLRETPRDVAFCAYTILSDQLTIVPDALADERFATNPLVTSAPNIRFYAGAPLVIAGHCIGALCLIDFKPRDLDPDQGEALTILSRQVIAHIELRLVRQNEARLLQERELERARTALSDQERLLEAILDHLVDGVAAVGRDGRVLLANGALRRLLDASGVPERLADWPARCGLRHADDADLDADDLPLARALRGEAVDGMELRMGDRRRPTILIATARPLSLGPDAAIGAVMTLRDATAEREAQRASNEDQQRLRLVLAQLPAAVWTVDADLRLTSALGGRLAVLGLDDPRATQRPIDAILAPRDEIPVIATHRNALGGTAGAYEIAREGRSLHCHVEPLRDGPDGAIIGAIGVALDVTEQRRLEGQVQQTQRLESVGRLAGGMAHDFNNILTVIFGYADLILHSMPAKDPLRSRLEGLRQAADRAAALIRQLLAFSRKQVLDLRPLAVNQVVRGLEPMLERLLGEDVQLTLDLAEPLPEVRADPAQLESVVMNLAINARDAMPRGGRLRIATRVADGPGAGAQPARATDEPAGWVELRIQDDGTGMDPVTAARAFEPFFTTKAPGKGTGLGLAMVFGVIAQCGGSVAIETAPDAGTSVLAWLPAVAPATTTEPEAPAKPSAHVAAGTGRVLLVEDDQTVRDLAAEILEADGFIVTVAHDGAHASRIAEATRIAFDLLITDIVLPGMSGLDLAQTLRARWPELRVLLTSGYSEEAISRYGEVPRGGYLDKPYALDELVARARQMLD